MMQDKTIHPMDFFDLVLAAHPLSEGSRRSLADKIRFFLQTLDSQSEHGGYVTLTNDALLNHRTCDKSIDKSTY
jgi:hypothetical protein